MKNNIKETAWVPCSEMLPEEFHFVLVCLHNRVMTVASRIQGTFYNIQGDEIWPPVAWMELPEPYATGKKKGCWL